MRRGKKPLLCTGHHRSDRPLPEFVSQRVRVGPCAYEWIAVVSLNHDGGKSCEVTDLDLGSVREWVSRRHETDTSLTQDR